MYDTNISMKTKRYHRVFLSLFVLNYKATLTYAL